jgi:hypothetical protein
LGTNAKQAFQLALIVLGFVTLVAWCAQVGRADVLWAVRLGTPMVGVAVGWWFRKSLHRPEKLEDLLARLAPGYLEREGLCFMPVLETEGGCCRMSIYFQNRYSGHASAQVEVRPPMKTLGLGRHPLPTVAVQVECPGAAFGVIRVPFPIPDKYQGRRMQFEMGADARYPARRGELLRFRSGKGVGSIRDLDQSGLAALALLSLPLALLALSQVTRLRLALPTGVAEVPPLGAMPQTHILFAPQLGTGGFPLMAARDAA